MWKPWFLNEPKTHRKIQLINICPSNNEQYTLLQRKFLLRYECNKVKQYSTWPYRQENYNQHSTKQRCGYTLFSDSTVVPQCFAQYMVMVPSCSITTMLGANFKHTAVPLLPEKSDPHFSYFLNSDNNWKKEFAVNVPWQDVTTCWIFLLWLTLKCITHTNIQLHKADQE